MDTSFKNSYILITDNVSCRNSNWYLGDLVTPQGARVKALTSFYDLNKLIKTPTHLIQNSATSIVHSSLSSTCHHEIVFTKLNLKVE